MGHNLTADQQVPISACNDFGSQILVRRPFRHLPTKSIKHEYHVIRWTYVLRSDYVLISWRERTVAYWLHALFIYLIPEDVLSEFSTIFGVTGAL